MPGPEQLIRVAVLLPFKIAQTVTSIAIGLLPGDGDDDPPTDANVDIMVAADDAMTRERDPVEEATVVLDDETEHVDAQVEIVAQSADPEATESPGPEIHVDTE